ncbi:MAG: biotin/lipoyl-containing protein, partial [Pseudomonadota bacterium]|nr:biotin/lipoyl-containing protein [Pseudomonadota bacterium]
MSLVEVRIPDVGDAEEVEVIEICVAEGDEIPIDTTLVVLESEKASMELPAEVAGKVVGINLAVGDIVNEGDLVATIETDGNPARTDEADSIIDEVREDKTSAKGKRRYAP